MTLRTSSNSINPCSNLFKFTVKRNIGVIILFTLIMLLVCPGYVLNEISEVLKSPSYLRHAYDLTKNLNMVCIGVSITVCALSALFCCLNFSFLYSKKSGDVYFSLPLTRNELFISRFFASTVPLLIPTALCYLSLWFVSLTPYANISVPALVACFAISTVAMFMTASITMLFIVCSGSVLDLLISFFGVNVGLILCATIFSGLCNELLLGYSSGDTYGKISIVSPFFYAVYKVAQMRSIFTHGGWSHIFGNIWVFVVRLLVTGAVAFTAAILLHRRRKSEKCEDSYAYSFMYYACSLIIAFVVSDILGELFGAYTILSVKFWVFAAIGSVLAAVTYGAISNRGFKTVKKSIVTGIIPVTALGLITVILATGGLGYKTRIPAAHTIKSAEYSSLGLSIDFEDPELITALHKKAIESATKSIDIDEYSEDVTDSTYNRSYQYFDLTYNLAGGRTLKRSYHVQIRKCVDELLAIYRSDEHGKALKARTALFVRSGVTAYDYGSLGDNADVPTLSGMVTGSTFDRLIDAYVADIKNATEASIYQDGVRHIQIDSRKENNEYISIDLYVEEGYTETLSILDELHLQVNSDVE